MSTIWKLTSDIIPTHSKLVLIYNGNTIGIARYKAKLHRFTTPYIPLYWAEMPQFWNATRCGYPLGSEYMLVNSDCGKMDFARYNHPERKWEGSAFDKRIIEWQSIPPNPEEWDESDYLVIDKAVFLANNEMIALLT